MKTRRFSCMLLLSITATVLVYGQGEKKPRTVEDYRPRTLRELSTLLPDAFRDALAERGVSGNQDLRVIVHGELFPSRVKVLYGGTTRPLIEIKKSVIKGWANRFGGAPEFYTDPYQTEALFTEDGERYWLAVRTEFLPKFEQELKRGEAVELFVIKLGSGHVGDKLEPVLLVEKFLKQ